MAVGLTLRTPHKRALSIAVRYRHLQDKDLELTGTHSDPPAIKKLLTEMYGYKEEDITILMDDDIHTPPTRDNILQAMKNLVHDAQSGDQFVFHFSGHGSQIPAVKDLNEEDGMDEVIWPVDIEGVDKEFVDNGIIDDDIRDILVNHLPPDCRLVMVFDCCNSGTAADLPDCSDDVCRDDDVSPIASAVTTVSCATNVNGKGILGNNGIATAYALKRHVDGEEVHETQIHSPVTKTTTKYPGNFNSNEPYVTSWSACKDGQVTFEGDYGLFVHAFTRSLRRKPHQSHHDLLRALTHELQVITSAYNRTRAPHEDEAQVPRPQLGSLRKVDDLFHATFFL